MLFQTFVEFDYCCIINGIDKSEAAHLLQKADISEQKYNIIKYDFSLSCIKDGQRNYIVW